MLSATNSSIAMAASNEFLAKHFLRPEQCDATMTIEDMKIVIEKYVNLASPNIKNAISNFKYVVEQRVFALGKHWVLGYN